MKYRSLHDVVRKFFPSPKSQGPATHDALDVGDGPPCGASLEASVANLAALSGHQALLQAQGSLEQQQQQQHGGALGAKQQQQQYTGGALLLQHSSGAHGHHHGHLALAPSGSITQDGGGGALSSGFRTTGGQDGEAYCLSSEVAFPQLLLTLASGTPEQRAVAAEALFNYTAESDAARQRATQAGAVAHLVELLRCGTDHGRMYAAYTLSSLTATDEPLEQMRAHGAIPALIDILSSCPLLVCKKGAMRALGRLARSDEAAHDIVAAGGLGPVIALLSRPDSSLVRRCLIALYFIGADKDALQQAIGSAGALPQLLQLARSDSADVQAEATDVLKVLCRNGSCGRAIAVELQGVDVLVGVAQGGLTSRARASAGRALQRLHDIPELKEAMAASAAKDLALPDSASLSPALSSVLNTGSAAAAAAAPVPAQTAPAAAAAAAEHPAAAAAASSDGAAAVTPVAAAGGADGSVDVEDIQQLAQVLASGSRWLREKAAAAVEQLAADNPAACRELADLGALPSLLDMLDVGNSSSTRRAAARALGALGGDALLLVRMSDAGVVAKLLAAAPQLAGSAQRAVVKVLHALAGVQQTAATCFPREQAVQSMMRVLSEGAGAGPATSQDGGSADATMSGGSGGGASSGADATTCARVLEVLLAVCRADGAALHDVKQASGGLRLLVSKLQYGARSAAGIILQLLSLLSQHKQHQEDLLKCGAVPTLLLLYRSDDAAVAAQAARILEALSEPASNILQRTLSGTTRAVGADGSSSSSGSSSSGSPSSSPMAAVAAARQAEAAAASASMPAAAGSKASNLPGGSRKSYAAVIRQQPQPSHSPATPSTAAAAQAAQAAPSSSSSSSSPVRDAAVQQNGPDQATSRCDSPTRRVAAAAAAIEAATAAQAAVIVPAPTAPYAAVARASLRQGSPSPSGSGKSWAMAAGGRSPGTQQQQQQQQSAAAAEQPQQQQGQLQGSCRASLQQPQQQQPFVSRLPRRQPPRPSSCSVADSGSNAATGGAASRCISADGARAAARAAGAAELARGRQSGAGPRSSSRAPRPSSSPAAGAAAGSVAGPPRPASASATSLRLLAQQRRTQQNLAAATPGEASGTMQAQQRQQEPAAPAGDDGKHSGRVMQLAAAMAARAQSPQPPTRLQQAAGPRPASTPPGGASSGGPAGEAQPDASSSGRGGGDAAGSSSSAAAQRKPAAGDKPVQHEQQQLPVAAAPQAAAAPPPAQDASTAGAGGAASPSAAADSDDLLSSTYDNLHGLLLKKSDIAVCRTPEGRKCRLGEGGFGIVYKAVMNGVDEVAVKLVKAETPSRKELELFLKEVQTLAKLHHRNIVQFYGACLETGSMFFVTELMKGGDLYSALRHHAETMKWERLGRKVALDVALGLNYLHAQRPPMMHRDLKSPNVLLSEEGVAKIADVGMVRSQVKDLVTAQPVMTPLWAAPEVVRHERASIKADIWSYGILIWELITGEDITEYQPLSISRQVGPSPNAKAMTLPARCPPVARKLFVACTQMDPERRPCAQQLVEWLRADIAGHR